MNLRGRGTGASSFTSPSAKAIVSPRGPAKARPARLSSSANCSARRAASSAIRPLAMKSCALGGAMAWAIARARSAGTSRASAAATPASQSRMPPSPSRTPKRSIAGLGSKVTKRIPAPFLRLDDELRRERADRCASDLDAVAWRDRNGRIDLVAGARSRDRRAQGHHIAGLEHGARPGLGRLRDAVREIGRGESLALDAVDGEGDIGRAIEIAEARNPDGGPKRRKTEAILRKEAVAGAPFALEHGAVGHFRHQREADHRAGRVARRDARS